MSLKKLQEKIGVDDDGVFGKNTLKAAAKYFNLSNERAAHFFGQCGCETGNFKVYSENLNYSAVGLIKVFGKYFTQDTANQYAHHPDMIGSRVYGNRLGNGAEATHEGYTYRGRGAIQTTGKANYKAFSDHVNKPEIMTTPDLVATDYSFESAFFFFDKNKLWSIADKGVNDDTILSMTKRVNGGVNGLDLRSKLTKQYYAWLQEK